MPTHDAKYRDEISKYYSKLSSFTRITGHDQLVEVKKTKRAEKARSKLSSLSTRQFYELNVDVNDELDRRINETGTETITLKDGEKEAVEKRNNARRKLAALSEVRFDELVNDLISEIELRGMDKIVKTEEVEQKETEGTLVSSFNMSDLGSISPQKVNDREESTEDSKVDEEVEDISLKGSEENMSLIATPNSPTTAHSGKRLPKLDNDSMNRDEPAEIANDIVLQSPATNDNAGNVIKSDPYFQTSHIIPIKASVNWSDDDEDESPTKMEQDSIGDIETPDHSIGKNNAHFIKTTQNDVAYESLLNENNILKQELHILKMKQNDTTASNYLSISSSEMGKMERYIDNDLGYIPVHLAEKFHDTIDYFYKTISEPQRTLMSTKNNDESSPDTTLFKIIFQISKISSQIITLVDIPIFKQEIILLKAAISQAITTTRYYSMYGNLLPKLTVHAAISDISFSFCNLIKMTKLKTDRDQFQSPMLSGVNDTPVSTYRFTKDLLIHNTNEADKVPVEAKPLKLARNLKNHKAEYLETPSKLKIPVRNESRRRSKRSSFRKSKQLNKEIATPHRNPSRPTSKTTNALRESSQDSFDFNKTPTILQNNYNGNKSPINHTVSRNTSISSSLNYGEPKSTSTSIDSRKTSKSSLKKWNNNNKKGKNNHEKNNNNTSKPVANSPTPTKTSKKSAKRFADKIKNFGNNNSLGLRMMPSENPTKVK
ncbi:similar to Saccharomyces cerevisiae YLL021W SPA2 Component of the polarisome, which functions in actin cytoskeletal organization during polarized growth [Maudiozyma saulgeensis]|uniref:Similar to Saccharomyces cerevisiae YLL021W SPA2 Component of the polarisome, which functions in actin cytoskeletal organization during polarized growth n=1 Tax=Maudiozyma saulgeensis TaxID=1789683 RepID=A0A1X7R5C9_9SACH|nr:similar to Saccharomyces cerevisiae YLL021W SPA2 Component of the polarisome, which functions in actin cytoskeletal organization during polarized growth [Kazachstania saulgeensis]